MWFVVVLQWCGVDFLLNSSFWLLISCIVLGLYLLLEITFFLLIKFYIVPALEKFRKPVPTEVPPFELFTKIFRVMENLPGYTISHYLEPFFRGAKLLEIYDGNLRSFLAWSMFGKHLSDLEFVEIENVEKLLNHMKNRYPLLKNMNKGHNPTVHHFAVTLEPVKYIHRPLLLYFTNMITEIVFNQTFLSLNGFTYFEAEGLCYWYRPGKSSSYLPPFLILHGISPGWSIYFRLIKTFAADTDRAIILADLDAVKVKSMFFFMPSADQFTSSIRKILVRHQIPKVSLIGHSFGSITAAWLVRQTPDIISHIALLDPVSVLLFLPDAASKLVYGVPKTWMEYLLYYFVAREITISYALHRNFIWHQNILWVEDIPPEIGVVMGLAMCDEITNPRLQYTYLESCSDARNQLLNEKEESSTEKSRKVVVPIQTITWENFSHAQIMASPKHLQHFRNAVLQNENIGTIFPK